MQIRGSNPQITNLVLVSSEQEYQHQFSKHVKKFLVQARDFKDVVFAFKEGETSTNYVSLVSGSPYYEDLVIGPFTIYLKPLEDNTVVEIIEWETRD